MKPDVGKIGGDLKSLWYLRVIGYAEAAIVLAEQVEDLVREPAFVTEFKRIAVSWGQGRPEVAKALHVQAPLRGELKE